MNTLNRPLCKIKFLPCRNYPYEVLKKLTIVGNFYHFRLTTQRAAVAKQPFRLKQLNNKGSSLKTRTAWPNFQGFCYFATPSEPLSFRLAKPLKRLPFGVRYAQTVRRGRWLSLRERQEAKTKNNQDPRKIFINVSAKGATTNTGLTHFAKQINPALTINYSALSSLAVGPLPQTESGRLALFRSEPRREGQPTAPSHSETRRVGGDVSPKGANRSEVMKGVINKNEKTSIKNSLENKSQYKNYYTSYSKLSEIKLLTIGIASPLRILQWAEKTLPNGKIYGEVLNANTLHHKTFKPQKGGLFCERIFGPLKDFECACGKIQKTNKQIQQFTTETKNTQLNSSETAISNTITPSLLEGPFNKSFQESRKFCPDCDVEYTWSVIRRYQLGYIKLCSPVTHIWFLKGTPSYLSLLLNIKKRHLQLITYCSEFLTIEKSAFIASCFLLIPSTFGEQSLSSLPYTVRLLAQPKPLVSCVRTAKPLTLAGGSPRRGLGVSRSERGRDRTMRPLQGLAALLSSVRYAKQPDALTSYGVTNRQQAKEQKQKRPLLLPRFVNEGEETNQSEQQLKNLFKNKKSISGKQDYELLWLFSLINKKNKYANFLNLANKISIKDCSLLHSQFNQSYIYANFILNNILHVGFGVPNKKFRYSNSPDKIDFVLKPSKTLMQLLKKIPTDLYILNLLQQNLWKKASVNLKEIQSFQSNEIIKTSWDYLLKTSVMQSSNKAKFILLPVFIKAFSALSLASAGGAGGLSKSSQIGVNSPPYSVTGRSRRSLWSSILGVRALPKATAIGDKGANANDPALRSSRSVDKVKPRVLNAFLHNLKSKYGQFIYKLLQQVKCPLQLNKWYLNALTKFSKKNKIFKFTQVRKIEILFQLPAQATKNTDNNYTNTSNMPLIYQFTANKILKESNIFIQHNESTCLKIQFDLFYNSVTKKISQLLTQFLLNSFILDFYVAFYANSGLNVLPVTRAFAPFSLTPSAYFTNPVGRHHHRKEKQKTNISFNINKIDKKFKNLPAYNSSVIFTKPLVVLSLFLLFNRNKTYNQLKNTNKQSIKQNVFNFYKQFLVLKHQFYSFDLLKKFLFILVTKKKEQSNQAPFFAWTFSLPLSPLLLKGLRCQGQAKGQATGSEPERGGQSSPQKGRSAYKISEKFYSPLPPMGVASGRGRTNAPGVRLLPALREATPTGYWLPQLQSRVVGVRPLTPTGGSLRQGANAKKRTAAKEEEAQQGSLSIMNKKRLYNNVYTLSHRERWQNEKDWRMFTLFTFTTLENVDYIVINYKNRLFPFNTDKTNENNISKQLNTPMRPYSLLLRVKEANKAPMSTLQQERTIESFYKFSKMSSFYSGAGIVQQLINELNFYEIKKLDKQNRLVLYVLNKVILKLKKEVQIFVYNKTIQLELKELCKKRDLLIRRTKLVRKLFRKNSNVNSMILTLIPVLPPDLRPIVKMGTQIAASDLNRLYQRVIYRNDRLKKFLKDPATSQSYEMKYAQRLLQESVDNLLQNGKSGANSEKDARGRMLKSLSDILKGKQGRFRQFLLGKRVDYSGRSVIVVGPKLKLHECGLPLEMAKELYLPFLLKSILNKNYARTVIGAKTLIKNNASLTHELLREIMQVSPVLLNRAPTLHRLGIQAFSPKLVEGRAILLHPLVCSAFNADFDGDQMAVHIPITTEARAEAWKIMCAHNNILSTATGDPLAIPSQDMVLGCYYLTTQPTKLNSINNKQQLSVVKASYSNEELKVKSGNILSISNSLYYNSFDDVIKMYDQQLINVHTLVWVKCSLIIENGSDQEEPIEIQVTSFGQWHEITSNYYRMYSLHNNLINQFVLTTPGRILFNLILQNVASTSKFD